MIAVSLICMSCGNREGISGLPCSSIRLRNFLLLLESFSYWDGIWDFLSPANLNVGSYFALYRYIPEKGERTLKSAQLQAPDCVPVLGWGGVILSRAKMTCVRLWSYLRASPLRGFDNISLNFRTLSRFLC